MTLLINRLAILTHIVVKHRGTIASEPMIGEESSLPLLPTKGLTNLHKIRVWVNHTELHDDDGSPVDETLVNRCIA